MRYVAGVSWPRSGHHLLVRLLSIYFDDFRYCEHYIPEDCCKTFPCTRTGIHFSKSHDFGLSNKRPPGLPLIVQYRDFLPTLVSNFELYVRDGNPDTAEAFRGYSVQAADRYVAFIRRWVGRTKTERCLARWCGAWFNTLVIRYEDLIENPCGTLRRVVRFFTPDPVNSEKLAEAVRKVPGVTVEGGQAVRQGQGVKCRRRVEDFRFYDPTFFAWLDERVKRGL